MLMVFRYTPNILIVDYVDEDVDRYRAAIEVNFAEIPISVVGDGTSAVRLYEEKAQVPGVVLMEAMLPQRSGFLVLERLRRREGRGLPHIIMATSNQGKRHESWGYSLGADAYFYKPVREEGSWEHLLTKVTAEIQKGLEKVSQQR